MPTSRERTLQRQMVRACQALWQRGFVAATDGNITARLAKGRFLCTPSGMSKSEVREGDLVICDAQGKKTGGARAGKVSNEIRVHLAAYRARPDVGAVVHAHPPVATAFTFAGKEDLLRWPVMPEVVVLLGPVPAVPYVTPGTEALAEAAAPYFHESDVVLLAQRGAVAFGADPWDAYLKMEKLEHAATVLKHACELAELPDKPNVKVLDMKQVRELLELYGKDKPR